MQFGFIIKYKYTIIKFIILYFIISRLHINSIPYNYNDLMIVQEGEKIVCGTGEGTLEFFNWGQWGNISDRYPGHPMSVDCIVALNDDVILTGSLDGGIRLVSSHFITQPSSIVLSFIKT